MEPDAQPATLTGLIGLPTVPSFVVTEVTPIDLNLMVFFGSYLMFIIMSKCMYVFRADRLKVHCLCSIRQILVWSL